jgi:chromosomal replication initiator protein
MTFNRFIVGKGNKFAGSSALEVAKGHAKDYNPLYIYSQLAVGKTHLLHAIGNDFLKRDPYAKIRYLSAETFTSDFTYSIKNKKIYEFREKYSNLDLLLFDDVQILDNRKKTQEEFLFIFNAVYGAKHQVVIAGDKPPNELKNINSQLKSRLGSGLLTKIQMPDQNTKIDIIKNATNEDSFHIPDDVAFFLAKTNNDIKALIKNIVRIKTYASLTKGDISITLVKSIIKDRRKADIGIDEIKSITAGYFNISVTDLISKKKKRSYAYPRQIAMYLSRKYTDKSFKAIGASFGRKDHSTVIHAVRRIEKCNDQDERISDDIKKIENLIG